MQQGLDALGLLLPDGFQRLPVRELRDDLLDVAVALQVLDCQIAGGVLRPDLLVLEDEVAEADDALLDFRTVVDVDMAGERGVGLLIDLDDGVEQLRDAPAVAAHRRAHGHAQQAPQLVGVQLVPLVLQLVVHVQGHHGPEVHVDDLRRQVQVPLDVGGVHDVDDDVRHRIDQILPDIQFLRGIGRQGVGSGQVHQGDVIPLVVEMPLFRIDRHAGIVAHVLVRARRDIEKGGLAAVGIAHQGDADHVVPLLGEVREGPVQAFTLGEVLGESLQMLVADERLAGLRLVHHVDALRLFPAEGYLVPDDLVFDRVLERRVQDHRHFLPLDEAHLDEPLPEGTVTMDTDDDRLFPGLEFGKLHSFFFCALMAQR